MNSKNAAKLGVFLLVSLFAACGERTEMTGEIIPIERVCAYEKVKPVAVEGYLAADSMRCEKVSGKRSSSIAGCTFTIYANSNQTGASLPVFIPTSSWMSGKNNRLETASSYTKDIEFYDRNGNSLPGAELRIYDNDGNLIPSGSKIRVYSQLPNSDKCEFRMAERIERVEGELKGRKKEPNYRNFPMESF